MIGAMPQASWNAALNRRTLRKPAASATCVTGNDVSVSSCFASNNRRVACTASGVAPACARKSRRSCRLLSETRAASLSMDSSCNAPSAINSRAR